MIFKIRRYLQSRSREQWRALVLGEWNKIRVFAQTKGEKAAACALIFGIFIVVCYKFVFFVLAIAIIVGCITWNVALPESERGDQTVTEPENSDPSK